jgi:hypothetical protein
MLGDTAAGDKTVAALILFEDAVNEFKRNDEGGTRQR